MRKSNPREAVDLSTFTTTTVVPFCLSAYYSSLFPTDVDAFLGLGPARNIPMGVFSPFLLIPQPLPSRIGLFLDPQRPLLSFGDPPFQLPSPLALSETPPLSGASIYYFSVYEPQLCGLPLLSSSATDHWAFITTELPCLTLPQDLLARVLQLLDNCTLASLKPYETVLRCSRDSPPPTSSATFTTAPSSSPGSTAPSSSSTTSSSSPSRSSASLTFRLHFQASEDSELEINLDDLVVDSVWVPATGSYAVTYCVSPTPGDHAFLGMPLIGFGTRVLQNFYVELHPTGQVGFAQMNPRAEPEDSTTIWTSLDMCRAHPVCPSNAVFNQLTHFCDPIVCPSLMQFYDLQTGSCRYYSYLIIILLTFTLAAIVIDLFWSELYLCYHKKIITILQSDPKPEEIWDS